MVVCSVSPSRGTLDTLFTVSCSNWSDSDGIQGYSLFGWRENPSDLVMFAHSRDPTLELFFPENPENTSLLHLLVFIRDRFDSVIEVNISSVSIDSNSTTIDAFNETFTRLLSTLNQNLISQVLVSISQSFHQQSRREFSPSGLRLPPLSADL